MNKLDAIKYLESYIQFYTVLKEPEQKEKDMINAINTILDLYDKQEQDIEKLKSIIYDIRKTINTSPYTAYTLYGDILYESDDIIKILDRWQNE